MTDAPAPRRAFARDDVISSYVHELALSAGWRDRDRGQGPAPVAQARPIARARGGCMCPRPALDC
jgi:hypothetical protein